jgi:hypothetical protein
MALWGSYDQANNAPKSADAGGHGVSANGQALFGNTTSYGIFGVDTTEAGITTGDGKKIQHAGWNLRKVGTGPIISISANTNSYSPDGNVFVTFTGGGTANTVANASITTDGSKRITSVTLNSGGVYATTPTAAVANSNAVFTIVMGGRANRTQYETLVAMGSMTRDAENTIFPNS